MIKRARAAYKLLQKGKVVADPAKWKGRQITATALTGVIWASINTAEAFGYAIPIDSETVDAVAVGFLALINWLLTLSTSKKVGL